MFEHYTVRALAQPFTTTGTVIEGDQSGRTIGFPTANLDVQLSEKELPIGIYFGTCTVTGSNQKHFCLPYFGPRLVFGEEKNQFEVYIYDFDEDIYNKTLTVTCTHFLRKPFPFTDMQSLKLQLKQDKKQGEQLIAAIMAI